jgi:hypothetical protein
MIAGVVVTCYRCGCQVEMPQGLHAQRMEDHKSFWCPNGHEQRFTGEDERDKKIRELERALSRAKGQLERKGHCFECDRQFQGRGGLRQHRLKVH